jgi:hypothetical protein
LIASVWTYDLARFDFPAVVKRLFDIDDLSQIGRGDRTPLLDRQSDQSTTYHAAFYSGFASGIATTYRRFVAEFVPTVLGTTEFCFQKVPTFRIHLLGNVAVGEFHRDGDYNHASGEVNFWLPLTKCWESNSLWIERQRGHGDYAPVQAEPGEVLVFDAVHWAHGNRPNTTGVTRVSFDFRCIPMELYRESDRRSVSAGRRLSIGDYFDVL